MNLIKGVPGSCLTSIHESTFCGAMVFDVLISRSSQLFPSIGQTTRQMTSRVLASRDHEAFLIELRLPFISPLELGSALSHLLQRYTGEEFCCL